MDSKSPSSSPTPLSGQSLKRKDAPDSTDSATKKSHTIIDCMVASEIFQELGCTTHFLNSGKVLAWALDPTDLAFQHIHTYVERSQGAKPKVKVLSILRIMTNASSLETGATPLDHDDIPENKGQLRKMLWHGTVAYNVPSILQNGLKLPKRDQPDPWFGDGIYFSDNFSYSLGYCRGFGHFKDKEGRKVGYLFLSDVRLGNIHQTLKREPKAPQIQTTRPKPGGWFWQTETLTKVVESVQGCGLTTPDPKGDQMIQGCIWPLGTITTVPTDWKSYPVCGSSEFVVYETKRVIPKFLIKVEAIPSCSGSHAKVDVDEFGLDDDDLDNGLDDDGLDDDGLDDDGLDDDGLDDFGLDDEDDLDDDF